MTANGISSGSDLLTKCHTFSQELLVKIWHGLAPMGQRSAGASSMIQHHLSESYEGYSMLWMQLIWFHDCQ
jgi:hypothetical protein